MAFTVASTRARVVGPTLSRGTVITQEDGGLRYGRSSARLPRLQISTSSVDAIVAQAGELEGAGL